MKVATAFTAPLFWTQPRADGASTAELAGHGSLFFLDLGGPTFGVTAEHVYAGYLRAKKDRPGLLCRIGEVCFSPEERLIDHEPWLDLATFRVSRAELGRIGRRFYPCPQAKWPPAPPKPGEVVVFAGFLSHDREVREDGSVRFGTTLVRAPVTDVNDRHVACTFGGGEGVERCARSAAPRPLRLRGASGTPLWARADGPLGPWKPAGIVKKCLEHHRVLVAIRPDVIRPDGTLIRWS